MSKPPEHENGTYGANTADGAPGAYDTHGGNRPADVPEASPTVYHPQPEPSPVYQAYADPAAAHGWAGNAYDETTELPPVVDGADGAHEHRGTGGASAADGGYDYVYEDGYDYDYGDDHDAGRAGRRSHRGRHQPGVWTSRRIAVAAGAVGAVSVAALIAGFAMSGSSSEGGAQTKDDRTGPTAGSPVIPTELSGGTPGGARKSDVTESSGSASPTTSTNPSASASDDKTDKPSTDPTATSTAPSTPTATATAEDKPGRGQGNAKKPG